MKVAFGDKQGTGKKNALYEHMKGKLLAGELKISSMNYTPWGATIEFEPFEIT